METIATFTSLDKAEQMRQVLDADNHQTKILEDNNAGLYSVQVSRSGPAPDSVPGFAKLSAEMDAISCLECGSSEVQYPASPGDQWVLPRVVAKVASAIATDTKNHLRCRRCDYEWSFSEDSRVVAAG